MIRPTLRGVLCGRMSSVTLAALATSVLGTGVAAAATILPATFTEMVHESSTIVRVTVVELEARTEGLPIVPSEVPKDTVAPAVEPEPEIFDDQLVAPAPVRALEPPIPVDIEGGQMIFTYVTLSRDDTIKGSPPDILQLRMPGGVDGERRVWVPGLPTFELGRSYVLFLRPDWASVGDPMVGVNQGFLPIDLDPVHGEVLLNVDKDYLIGVEEDAFVVRFNERRIDVQRPQLVAAPTPTPGSDVLLPIERSDGERYWTSEEPPLTPMRLAELVRAVPRWDAVPATPEIR